MTCWAEGCETPPVRQWQRAASDAEYAEHAADLTTRAQAIDQARRDRLALEAASLRSATDGLPSDMTGDRLRALVGRQVARLDAEVAALDATPTPDVTPDVVLVAVFGCDEHAVDEDSAARTHEAGCCTTTEGCRCAGVNDGANT